MRLRVFLLTSRYDGYFLITADKQLFYQDANQSDAFIAEKVHYVSTKGRAQFEQTILIIKSHQYIPIRLHKQSNNNRYELLMTHYALIYGSVRTMVIL